MKKPDLIEKMNKAEDKITDKAFSRAVITSVFGIIVCLIMLGSATWAWFAKETTSASNAINTGNFTAQVVIYSTEEQTETVDGVDEASAVEGLVSLVDSEFSNC